MPKQSKWWVYIKSENGWIKEFGPLPKKQALKLEHSLECMTGDSVQRKYMASSEDLLPPTKSECALVDRIVRTA